MNAPVKLPVLPTEPAPFAGFILDHLMQPVDTAPDAARAVAETEHPFTGDNWFWADDNAKALELLTLPALWPACGPASRESFRFLASLCHGPFIFRRTSHPRMLKLSNTAEAAAYTHAFLSVEADLRAGFVDVGMRFHDGRDARNLRIGGHRIAFTAGGRRQEIAVAEALTGGEAREEPGGLTVALTGEVSWRSWGRPRRLGALALLHRFRADSGAFEVEAVLEVDAAAEVSDVTITLGSDRLSHGENGVTHDALHGLRADGSPLAALAGKAEIAIGGGAGARYWCLAQNSAMRGFALGIHALPLGAGRVAGLRIAPAPGRRLAWLGAEHGFPGPQAGARLVAAERRVITAGGFYDLSAEYAALLGDGALMGGGRATDISISYDYGAELVAFARVVRLLSRHDAPDAAMRDEAAALYDRVLGVYRDRMLGAELVRPGSVFSRPLAFVVQSLCDMILATRGDRYRAALAEAVEALLGFARAQRDVAGGPSTVFLMGHSDATPYMDCHAAALLALVRAVPLLPDALAARARGAIDGGLHAFSLATVVVEFEGPKRQDVVAVDFETPTGRQQRDGFWNFCAGLALRAFRALARSQDTELRRIAARHEERISLLRTVIQHQLRRSLRPRGDAVEVRTSVLSGETNSETQPWVALALVRHSGDW